MAQTIERPRPTRAEPIRPPAENSLRVAYIMSRFPKLTETFVLFEMLAVEREGVAVDIYPLMRERTDVVHPEAVPLVERAHFRPFFSGKVLRAQLAMLLRKPGAYVGALGTLIRANLGSPNFLFGGLALFPKVALTAQEMAEAGVEHVHAHFCNHPAAAAFIIHRLTGIPYSFTAHGSDLHIDRHMLREKVAEAAFVVTISGYNRRLILEECGEQYADKIRVIHCGVDPTVFQPRAETAPVANRPFTLLCTGTLHEVKGQTYLIEACRILRERGIDLQCRFVGDGPDRPALEAQIAAAGLGECVHLAGRQTRDQVAALLAEADVVIAPSVPTQNGRREGIPVALMEAMATGAPVVASRLSGIPELVVDGETGLLAPPRDAAAIADVLQRLHDDPELRRRLGEAGREKVLRDFNLFANAATLTRCIREAVGA